MNDSAARLRQIERYLHDGAQARMVAVAMKLGLATKNDASCDLRCQPFRSPTSQCSPGIGRRSTVRIPEPEVGLARSPGLSKCNRDGCFKCLPDIQQTVLRDRKVDLVTARLSCDDYPVTDNLARRRLSECNG